MNSLTLRLKPSVSKSKWAAKVTYDFLAGLGENKEVRTTRSGLATQIGPDGTLQWGPHNLLGESQCDDGFVALGTTPPTVTSFQQFAGESCTSAVFTAAMTATYAGARIDRGNSAGHYKASIVNGRSYIQSNFIGLSRSLIGVEKITVLWTGASGVASVDITSANSAQYVGVLARIATPPAAMVSTGQNYPVIYLTGALSSNLTVYTNKGMLEDVTGTNRTTPSDYVDSTVKNRLGYSNDFANAVWSKHGATMQVYEKTCTGPNGQPATTLVAGSANAEIHQSCTLAGVYTAGFLIRRRLGTGAISLRNSSNSTWLPQPITTDWAFYQNDGGTSGGTAYCDLLMATAGDQIDICDARLVPGTSAANYSYNPGAAPAVGPIYGQRTDYDVSTVSGIGPDLLGGAGSFDSAAGWALGAGWSIDNGVARAVVASGILTRQIALTAGKAYLIEVSNPDGAAFQVRLGGVSLGYRSSTTISLPAVATSSLPLLELVPNGPVTCSIDNITVQEAFSGKIAGYGPDLLGGIGTFDAATGWTLESGMSVSGGVLVATGAISKNAVSTAPVVATRSYIATWDQVGTGVNDTRINIKSPLDNIQVGGAYINGTGPKFAVFTASVSGSFALFNYAGGATYDNLIVKEIIFASKGALIEPTQVTQLLANPDDLSASPWGGSIACTDDGTKFRGRRFWKCAKTTADTSEYRQNTGASFTSGYFTAGLAFLASSNCAFVDFGLLGGTSTWGNAGDTTCSIDSGPGTLIQVSGGLWRLSGLSTNVPTVVTVVRNLLVAETASVFVYPDGTGSTTIGKAVYVQVDNLEAGRAKTSFIPNPATSGTVVRVADTSSVGYDDLAKALPWLMDTNIVPSAYVEDFSAWTKTGVGTGSLPIITANDTTYAAPDGTFTADKVVFNAGAGVSSGDQSSLTVASMATVVSTPYTSSFMVMGPTGAKLVIRHVGGSGYGLVTCSGLGIWDVVPGRTEAAFSASSDFSIGIRQGLVGTINATATVWLWGAKLNPGPVAQTYYPQSRKQATILFEGDAIFGAGTISTSLVALENGASNRVLHYFTTGGSFKGFVNATSATLGFIASGAAFKSVVGFSPSSAGTALNGSAESAITPSTFSANPNVLKIGNDANGNAASSMHIRRLRIFNTNLPASTKQALTR